MFSPQQNQRRRGQNMICLEAGVEGKTMYTYVSKCKNAKILKIKLNFKMLYGKYS
jgi:hypothetical protein